MTSFFAALGRFAVRFRWAVVAAWVAAAVLATAFLPSLSSVTSDSSTGYLPARSPSVQAARLAAPFQAADQTPVPVLVARAGGPLTAADTAATGRLGARLAAVPAVRQVQDLGVSSDRQAAQLLVLARIDVNSEGPAGQLVDGLRRAIGMSALPPGLRAHLAGPVAAQTDVSRASNSSGDLGEDLSIVFILVLLLVVFRAVLAPLLTLAPAVLVTQLAGPVIAEASRAGLRVSSLTQILLLVLVIGAGTDYGLFLVFRVREELRAGQPRHDAVIRALSRVGESVAFSAGTVIAALLTLLLATFGLFSGLGVPLAIAIGLMLAAALTLLPALLAIFGRAAFWPSRTAGAAAEAGTAGGAGDAGGAGGAGGTGLGGRAGWWGAVAGRIVTRPVAVLALGLAVFGGLAVAAAGYTPGGFGAGPAAPAGSDSAAGGALLAAHFPSASSNPTPVLVRFPAPVWAGPGPAAAAERRLAAVPQFAHLGGPLSVNGVALAPGQLVALHARLGDPRSLPALPPPGAGVDAPTWAAYRAESQFISPDGRTVRFTASLAAGDPDSNTALAQVPAIRAAVAAAARASGATAWGLAGDAAVTYDVSRVSGQDLLRIVPVAIIVIGLLLALVLRSAVAPVYLIASVVLSYLAALGVAVLVFQGTGARGGLPYFVPFLMFLFLLALGEDYNILVMSRIREEAAQRPLRQAVSVALSRTGSTVTSAGLVLAGTFGVFAVVVSLQPGGAPYRAVLFSLAIGILMDAFLVRTLLVPSAVALLGRWNWWPSPASGQRSPGRTGGGGDDDIARRTSPVSTPARKPMTWAR
jgi:RND superfamily putative drug exporter